MLSSRLLPAILAASLAAAALSCSSGSSPTTAPDGRPDADRDGIADVVDNCPDTVNSQQFDSDGDDVGNVCDNCPYAANAGQSDLDLDGTGDACENGDSDGDGIRDGLDNCPFVINAAQRDNDLDGDGDACDADIDNDGLENDEDPDRDGDRVANGDDSDPDDRRTCRDVDGDTCDDCASGIDSPINDGQDSDGDGFCDAGLGAARVTVSVDASSAIYGVQTTLGFDLDLQLAGAEAAGPYDPANYGAVVPGMLSDVNTALSGRVIFAATFTDELPDPSFTGPAPVLVADFLFDDGAPGPGDFDLLDCELVDATGLVLGDGDCSISSIAIDP